MDESETAPVISASTQLVEAIENHAIAAAESSDDETILTATDGLREAAWRYVCEFMATTQWGNPFAGLEEEAEESTEEVELPHEHDGKARGAPVYEVQARYRVAVRDRKQASYLVAAQAKHKGTTWEPVEDAVDVISALFQLDGWAPWKYGDSIDTLFAEWTCEAAK